MSSQKHNRVPPRFVEEYLEVLTRAQSFQTSSVRHWTLLKCYAELQYKLNGGSKCPVCRAHVRHVIPVTIERVDGKVDQFHCLCTRCFEGERAVSKVLTIQMGDARIDYRPHQYGERVQRVESPQRTAHQMPVPPPL